LILDRYHRGDYRVGVADRILTGPWPPTELATPTPPAALGADVVAIGDMTVTGDSVLLPRGRFPLRGTTWTIQDATTIVRYTPPWALMLAIGLSVTLVGLLFLLVKRERYGGCVRVTVVGDRLYHSATFPPGPESRAHAAALVNRARALTALLELDEAADAAA
jgi:hypothetical protein